VNDDNVHKGLRSQLVKVLIEKGIKDENVLNAIGKVPRHLFFDKEFQQKYAYDDIAFPIGAGQTISQPYTVAFQTSLLQVKKRSKILEIGTGSGYQAAVLCELGAKVFSVERQQELFEVSNHFLKKMGYNPKCFYGDGFIGREVFAPYDGILVTCGAPYIPEPLKLQLKINGRLVIPVGEGETQQMKLVVRLDEDEFSEETLGAFSFVPMLKNKT
jgi:protein-L-isoaspartate(D-aspartate) O-methyltransferase